MAKLLPYLEVNKKAQSGYPYNLLMSSDTALIFVDDLRAADDPSLVPVPRITTYEQLVSVFGLGIATRFGGGEATPGNKYFKLVGFYIRTGVAEFIPKVLGENGDPLGQILVWGHWPDAPIIPNNGRPDPDYFADGRGVAGFTNSNGDIGFPYGGGAVTNAGGGPYAIWPNADPESGERHWADAAIRLGWIGGTDHLTANPIFQVTTKSGDPPPPTSGDSYVSVVINGVEEAHVGLTARATIEVG